MNSSTPFSGRSGNDDDISTIKPRSKFQNTLATFTRQWIYIGFAIILSVLNIILGIWTVSYLHFKKEPLMFGVVCFGVLLGLAHFASLCYLFRAKDENTDPMMVDVGHSIGVALLFSVSGIALTVPLPSKCYARNTTDAILIGKNWCNTITTMAVSAWLAVIIMIIATILTYISVRHAIEQARMPPPISTLNQAETPTMRWLDRSEVTTERFNRQYP